MEKREDIHHSTDTVISLSHFTTDYDSHLGEGLLCNYSLNEIVIESERSYPKGSVLVVKAKEIQQTPSRTVVEEGFRSIGLAEVKWLKGRKNDGVRRYRIGLKYLR